MDTDHEDLDLGELADAGGVSARTIRYYVQQGLLPSPGTRGPKTRYERGLLDRLRPIKVLQRQHLPVSEIRRTLEGSTTRVCVARFTPPPSRRGATRRSGTCEK
jgi:DNA-binding transcriptional MerR regulator